MHLLLTNDDGIDAPGLAELQRLASQWGQVTVVAPKHPWSGCGHRICTDREIEVVETRPGWWSVDAFPADCVRIALACLVDSVDWVLAGINDGGNLGADVYMSGTVAAAREAALFGQASVAVSQYRSRHGKLPWVQTAEMASRALDAVMQRPTTIGSYWNINLPDPSGDGGAPIDEIEMVDCPVDANPLPSTYDHNADRRSVMYSGRYQDRLRDEHADVQRCFAGSITISRLAIS
jgi:5'-nucleotidase